MKHLALVDIVKRVGKVRFLWDTVLWQNLNIPACWVYTPTGCTDEVDEGRNKTIAFSANRIGTFVCQIINIVSVIIVIIFMLAVINITMTIKTEKLTYRELMRVEHATTQICSDEKI